MPPPRFRFVRFNSLSSPFLTSQRLARGGRARSSLARSVPEGGPVRVRRREGARKRERERAVDRSKGRRRRHRSPLPSKEARNEELARSSSSHRLRARTRPSAAWNRRAFEHSRRRTLRSSPCSLSRKRESNSRDQQVALLLAPSPPDAAASCSDSHQLAPTGHARYRTGGAWASGRAREKSCWSPYLVWKCV